MTTPITISRPEDVLEIVHPYFGRVRYVEHGGERYVFRADLLAVCGFKNSAPSPAMLSPENQRICILEYKIGMASNVQTVGQAGVSQFSLGRKNSHERRQACQWILKTLYGAKIAAVNQSLFPAPLTDEQLEQVAQLVLEKLIQRLKG